MRVQTTDNPSEVFVREGYFYRAPGTQEDKWIEGDCKILNEDIRGAKEFAKELMKEENPRICQQWEHDYWKQMSEKYNSKQVGGALLFIVWQFTKPKYADDEDNTEVWDADALSAVYEKIKKKVIKNL